MKPESIELEMKIKIECPIKNTCPHARADADMVLDGLRGRIAELEAERDFEKKGKHANWIALTKMRDERDGLKDELETIKGNYDEYCRVCDERDELKARIDKVVQKEDGWWKSQGVRHILTGESKS